MPRVRLASETDFDGWRKAARALRAADMAPEQVSWTVGEGSDLFAEPPPSQVSSAAFRVPRAFIDLAQVVILHRSAARLPLLYRLLWRLAAEPKLMEVVSDVDVSEALHLKKEVDRSAYRMKQYVRFRRVAEAPAEEAYAAWIEPDHHVVERAAPFFVNRFANMRWAILTPDRCAAWDGEALTFSPGVTQDQAPSEDKLEDLWRTYFATTFNPARLKVKAMTAQMPRHLWRNLPEAEVIPSLIRQAGERTTTMAQAPHTQPNRRLDKAIARRVRDGSYEEAYVPSSTDEVWSAVNACRRCDLWRDATQGVAGEGPSNAKLMLVGEQPGDQEDLAGKPFVGPAGQLLDRALAEAGVPRAEAYVTNAVKHFKFEPRGKRRIHAKPNAGEISACKWWLDSERRLVRPKVIVALGATAGRAVFGKPVSVMKDRGEAVRLPDGATALLTVHPSYMLRLPDADDKAKAYGLFVQDLRAAMALA